MTFNSKVYRKQGGAEQVVASGGTVTFEPGSTVAGFPYTYPLGPWLFSARQLASGETLTTGIGPAIITSSADNPQLGLTSSGDQSMYLSWASAQVAAIKLAPIAMPEGLSTAGGFVVELKGESIGTATAADAAAGFDIRCWSGVGDTEMGATHPNFTSSPSWKGVRIASGDITTGPLNVTLVPSAHAGRAIRLYDARIRFNRTS